MFFKKEKITSNYTLDIFRIALLDEIKEDFIYELWQKRSKAKEKAS